MQIKVEHSGEILYWTLHHPEQGNALGTSFLQAADEALREVEAHCGRWQNNPDRETLAYRVLIVQASVCGAKAPIWIAGGNLKELIKLESPAAGKNYAKKMSELCRRLQELPIPTIMAIHGEAIGGGAELALAGDLRIASQVSALHFKQLQVGLATGYGSCKRLVDLIGLSRASQLLLRHQRLSAEEALSWGLIHELCPDLAQLHIASRRLAEDLCRLEPLAIACQKAMLTEATRSGAKQAQQKEWELFAKIWMNPTHKTYLQRFNRS